MSTAAAQRAFYDRRPPTLTGTYSTTAPQSADTKVTTLAVTNSAGRAAITALTSGKAMVTFKSTGGASYVAMKLGGAAATVTTATGFPLADGATERWWIDFEQVNDVEAITASSTATLSWFISSPIYEAR